MSEDLLDCLLSAGKGLSFEDALAGVEAHVEVSNVPAVGNSSLVHTGDTDSSDEEDKRNFENQRLSDCGKGIKNLLSTSTSRAPKETTQTWLTKRPVATKPNLSAKPSKCIFGISVINPLVASNIIDERMCNRDIIAFNVLRVFVRNVPSDKDWVVAGVIVHKALKTSNNSKKYCMWTLSDLKSELKSATVFLFGSAYKELWKTPIGMVVGVLNPNVFDGKESTKEEARFSVDNYQKIMIIGQSRDYAICKSMKKNGEHCTAFVNKSICEYCIYHVKQEYQQFCNRSEFQNGFSQGPRNLTELRNKVLGKDQVFYAGKLYTAVKNPKQVAKDKKRMQVLDGLKQNTILKKQKQKQAAHLELQANQRVRDLQRLKQLGVNTPLSSEQVSFNADVSQTVTTEDSKNLALKLKNSRGNPVLCNTPTLDRNTLIDLNIDFKQTPKSVANEAAPNLSKKAASAKQIALKWVQANGLITKSDPNNVRSENPKKRKLQNIDPIPNPQLSKINENEYFSERFKKMMAVTSSHLDLVKTHDIEQEEKYFNKLEKREQLEEKMLTTYKIPCKAVRCLQCKYTSFSASDLCKSERHTLKVFDAFKRFFKCGNCGNRTVCLEVVPTGVCKNCGHGKWERTGMMKERKIEIGAPKLSIRGGEQKFINSVVSDTNLDLMVPDE